MCLKYISNGSVRCRRCRGAYHIRSGGKSPTHRACFKGEIATGIGWDVVADKVVAPAAMAAITADVDSGDGRNGRENGEDGQC
jgi:hypothetical protein